jgi:hypothetical protein
MLATPGDFLRTSSNIAWGVTTLRKLSLMESIEIVLIELQYALADYYYRSEGNCAVDLAAIETPLRELRVRAISTQVAIDRARTASQVKNLS